MLPAHQTPSLHSAKFMKKHNNGSKKGSSLKIFVKAINLIPILEYISLSGFVALRNGL